MLQVKLVRPNAAILRSILYYFLVIATPASIFLWRLGSQTAGFSPVEVTARSAAKLSNIIANPLNLPYKLVENILFHLGGGHRAALRFTSVIFGMVFVFLFYIVLKSWFGKPIAFLTTLLLALTPLYLLSSRTAGANIMYVSSISVLFAYYNFSHTRHILTGFFSAVLALALCLYVPGLIWFLLIGVVFWYKILTQQLAGVTKRLKIFGGLGLVILISPLIYGFTKHPDLLNDWLLLPSQFTSPLDILKNIAWMLTSIIIKLPMQNDLSLDRLPLLNAAQIGLLAFGLYVIWSRLSKSFYWIVSSLIVVILLSAVNKNYQILIMALPFIAFTCGMGLRYLYVEWRKVFPKNPLAKSFAIILMSALVVMHLFFGVRYSLLAWPAAEHTRQVFMLK